MHGNSLEVFRRFGLPYFRPGMDVLEIGPDIDGRCRDLVCQEGSRYRFTDRDNRRGDDAGFIPMADDYAIGCADDSFDVVFSLSVIEHVRKVWRWMAELSRVARAGGIVICVNPVSWPYHAFPIDCWRLFPEAYKALFEDARLDHDFSWHGNLVPIDPGWRDEHGPQTVTDTIAVGRKPSADRGATFSTEILSGPVGSA